MAKKIGAIVSLSIIGILIIATIIMANVNIDFSINCAKPNEVWVQRGSDDTQREIKSSADVERIVNIIENASKEKALTALFNGEMGKEAVVSAKNSTLPETQGYYVRYHYNVKQKLMDGKEEYKDSNGAVVYYEQLVFTINDIEGMNVLFVYVIPNASQPKNYSHYYELEADLSELYDFLDQDIYAGYEN